MATHVFLALSRPVDGREDEFHRWYDAAHLPDVVDLCPGFAAGQRYYAGADDYAPAAWPSLALYRLESDDLERLHREVSSNVSAFTPSNGVFASDHAAWVYSAAGDDDAALRAWLDGPEAARLALHFSDDVADLWGPAGGVASPVLERGTGQRVGEHPTWRYLRLIRTATRTPPDQSASAVWTYHPRGARVHSKVRE